MQVKSSAVFVLSAAIVLATLIVTLSPLLWTDHYVPSLSTLSSTPLPAGCSLEAKSGAATQGFMPVVHCPAWVKYP